MPFPAPRRALTAVSAALALVFGLFAASPAPAPAAGRDEYRCLWVDVFHEGIFTPAQCDTMVATARAAGYNAIFVQVRKAFDAYYESGVEPKNSTIGSFDPLAHIIRAAHGGGRRMEVHAWLVAYRTRLPDDNTYQNPKHVFTRHPDWMGRRFDGAVVDSGDSPGRYYVDPGHPAAQEHIATVVRDILTRYDLDGVNFDYIRYPEGHNGGPSPWGYNPVAVGRFNALTGRTGSPDRTDPAWCEFRRRQISDMVRRAYIEVRKVKPRAKLSLACIAWGSPAKGFTGSDAYGDIFQDWPGLANLGFVDLMLPMNYKRESNPAQARWHREWAQLMAGVGQRSGRFAINVVDGEGLNTASGVLAQLLATRGIPGLAGVSTYCYAETQAGRQRPVDTAFFQMIRQQVFPTDANPPEPTWLTRPTLGLVAGQAMRGRAALDGATVKLDDGRITHVDGNGFWAFAKVRPGTRTVTLLDTRGGVVGSRTVEVDPGRVGQINLAAP